MRAVKTIRGDGGSVSAERSLAKLPGSVREQPIVQLLQQQVPARVDQGGLQFLRGGSGVRATVSSRSHKPRDREPE